VIIIGAGIHPLSGAWEMELIERFRVCLQACSCYFLHDNPSRSAQSRLSMVDFIVNGWALFDKNVEKSHWKQMGEGYDLLANITSSISKKHPIESRIIE
jgi:hypothetical protein